MTLQVQIIDPSTGRTAKINGEGELGVVVHPHPPVNEEVTSLPFRQFFTNDGMSTGSNDMRVDGSATSADFWIQASPTRDIYVKTISVIIADTNATLNKFGNLSALTNGIQFIHETQDLGTEIISDAIQTNLDFIRLGLGQPSIGDGTSAFRADLSGGGADSYLPVLDLSTTFGLPWGVRLRKGTKDKLIFRVRDDLATGIDQFDIIGYGTQL
jgi:hypothetical protein